MLVCGDGGDDDGNDTSWKVHTAVVPENVIVVCTYVSIANVIRSVYITPGGAPTAEAVSE